MFRAKEFWNFDKNIGSTYKDGLVKDVTLRNVGVVIDLLEKQPDVYNVSTLDSLTERLKIDEIINDSINVFVNVSFLDKHYFPPITKRDVLNMEIPDILEKYNITNFWCKIDVTKFIQLRLNLDGAFSMSLVISYGCFLLILLSWH